MWEPMLHGNENCRHIHRSRDGETETEKQKLETERAMIDFIGISAIGFKA